MKFGLSDQALHAIRDVLVHHPGVEEAVIFGSRSLERQHANSDVDIALRGEVPPLEVEGIALELDELPLPFHFDVFSVASIRHHGLREHISRAGRTLYRKAATGVE
jgi:predicted nucleotidyltransferase